MGQTWQRFMTGLPTVPVHDLRIHPRDRELIAATHGRGIWIADISALEQINDKVLAEDAHLFSPPTAYQFGDRPVEGQSQGHQVFEAPSPPYGAVITYRLATRQPQVRIAILDAAGDTMQVLNGPGAAGINRVAWNFAGKPAPRPPLGAVQKRDSALQMNRITFVLDSLDKAGANPMMTGMARQLVRTGDFTPLIAMFQGRGSTPGFGPPPPWNPRPGEQATGGRGGRGGAGAPRAVAGQRRQRARPAHRRRQGQLQRRRECRTVRVSSNHGPIPDSRKPSSGGGFGMEFLQKLGFGTSLFAAFAGGGSGVASGDYVAVMTSVGRRPTEDSRRAVRRGFSLARRV